MSNLFMRGHEDKTLCEVVDKANRPLCLLDMATVASQNLPHRAVGVILRAPGGRMLLRRQSSGLFCLSAFAILPAGGAAEDFRAELLKNRWGLENARVFREIHMPPLPANGNAFTTIFTVGISAAFAADAEHPDENLLVDPTEFTALIKYENTLSPLAIWVGKRLRRKKVSL